jgi:drug/metabolite transporter (DMT)-like permease
MTVSSTMKGVGWMVAAQLSFVAAWVLIKYLGDRLPLFEIVFFRAFFSLIILASLVKLRGASLRTRDPRSMFFRSLFGVTAMALSFYGMIHLNLGNAAVLQNTMPIFVALLAPLMLAEPFSWRQLVFVLTAFAGVALMLTPQTSASWTLSLVPLTAGFFGALSMIYVRRLATRESALSITFLFTAFCALVSLPPAFAVFVMPTPREWVANAVIGVMVTFGQLFLTRAYRFGRASTIAPFSYSSVIGSYLVAMLLFGEVPLPLTLVGALIIVASGVGVMFFRPPVEAEAEASEVA